MHTTYLRLSRRKSNASLVYFRMVNMHKLSRFIEQYNDLRMGFFVFDFYMMDWSFYVKTIINCVLYLLLVISMLHK